MKRIITIALIVLQLSNSTLNTYATECTTIIYYSKKDWIEYKNLIDSDFNQGDHSFVNNKGIECVLNTLGTIAFPYVVDSNVLKGNSVFVQNEKGNKYDPVVFSIGFGEEIELGEIEFELEAYNKKTGKALTKTIALNVDYPTNMEIVSTTSKQDRIKLNINKKTKNIYIMFDSTHEDNVYILKYFQINSYKQYRHIEWTKDKIENTQTKRIEVCQGTGKYDPDGTSAVWKQSANTIFSPSVKIVNDYVPIIRSQSVNYDWGRGKNTTSYTEPNSVREMGGYAKEIIGWNQFGEKPWIDYFSYGSYGIEYPYIPIDQASGIQYFVNPMYWSQTKTVDYAYATSTDKNWCNHLTGSSKTPCYKNYGHSTNSRLNVYDVTIKNYDNVIDPEFQKIKKVDYFLMNQIDKSEKYLFSAKEEVQSFDFNNTGIWKIKAKIQDLTGKEGIKESQLFYIDKEIPYAEFISNDNESHESIEVLLRPFDSHSGVNRWSYSISNDGGNSFTVIESNISKQEEKLVLKNAGTTIIKLDIVDNAGNENTVYSNEYKIIKQSAVIDGLISFSYDKGISNVAYAKIRCDSCSDNNSQTLNVYLDDIEILQKEITKKISEIQIEYVSNQPNYSKMSLRTPTDEMNLTIYEKTREYKETKDKFLDFEGVTASAISFAKEQINFKEKIKITYFQNKDEYFSGEGIDARVQLSYFNECATIENFVCHSGVYDKDNPLPYGNAQLITTDGAEPMREKHRVNDIYSIPFEYRQTDTAFILPQFFANLKTGEIYNVNEDNFIDAGNKWYTHPKSNVGEYSIFVEGESLGINEFIWKINQRYVINASYRDLYKIKFIEPKNPFPNGNSKIWENSLDWIAELNLKDFIERVNIEN